MNDSDDIKLQNIAAVIAAFGGIRPMAHKLDVPVSTVQGWKQRDAIPQNRVSDILATAAAHDVDLARIGADSDASKETDPDTPEPNQVPPESAGEPPVISRARAQSHGSVLRHNDRGAFLIAVIALIVAVAAGGWSVLGGGQTAPGAEFTDIVDRLKVLETAPRTGGTDASQQQFADDIADLRAAVDRIDKTIRESTGPTGDIDQLVARMRIAETKLGEVQRRTASEAHSAAAALSVAQGDIAQLRQQLSAVGANRSNTGQDVADAVSLALAAGRLQRALESGAPYTDVLVTLRAVSAGDAAVGAILDRLAERAGAGIPTRDALTRSFAGVARNVVAAANTGAASGWTGRTLQRIRNIASVRRIGSDVPGDAPDARVARAEATLLGGDLGGAVAELDGLAGAAAAAAATWLDGARARLDAEVAVDQLEALAIARLQAGIGGS